MGALVEKRLAVSVSMRPILPISWDLWIALRAADVLESRGIYVCAGFQMSGLSQADLAGEDFVNDLPDATLVGARLDGVLQKIEAGEALTTLPQASPTSNGLASLLALATAQIAHGTSLRHWHENVQTALNGRSKKPTGKNRTEP